MTVIIRNYSLTLNEDLRTFLKELLKLPSNKHVILNENIESSFSVKNNFESKNNLAYSNYNYNDPDKRALALINGTLPIGYDPNGAATYVIVVIVWYFLGVVAFVTWQMRKKKTTVNDYKNELLSQGLQDQVKTKQILEELRNPKMRKWAWAIYRMGSTNKAKNSKPVNPKYEMQVLANLNKRLNQIEKEKLKLQNDYSTSDSPSPIELQTISDIRKTFEEKFQLEKYSISEDSKPTRPKYSKFRVISSIDDGLQRLSTSKPYKSSLKKSNKQQKSISLTKLSNKETEVHFNLGPLDEITDIDESQNSYSDTVNKVNVVFCPNPDETNSKKHKFEISFV